MFRKILVANRGEIALRVMRTCRELGIRTVAVYSSIDAESLHTRYANEAYLIGPGPASESYLNMEKIIEVAKKSNSEGIHPGYGFLAENAQFAKLCEDEGIAFIGPNSKALARAGDKIQSRNAVKNAHVPITEGSDRPLEDPQEAKDLARRIGYPVIFKCSGGGGGIGMVVAQGPKDIERAFRTAQSSSLSSFGIPDVFIEKFHTDARHIEFQILADGKGHMIHLGERECSIQRRYQKLIEEAPSPLMTKDLRNRVGRLAVKAAKALGYTNAGTVEFIYSRGKFYFNEVNARLQVEHPITEMVTGVDLVREQLSLAAGEELGYDQQDIEMKGWSMECRVNAENPYENFLPSPGVVTDFMSPGGPGVRVDTALYPGCQVASLYDPLIAKLITWGRRRDEALFRMRRALEECTIRGIETNIPFHVKVLSDNAFIAGKLSTQFIAQRKIVKALNRERERMMAKRKEEVAAIVACFASSKGSLLMASGEFERVEAPSSRWILAGRSDQMSKRLGHEVHPGNRWKRA